MPFRTAYSSLKIFKISMASGGATFALSLIDAINQTAMIMKDLGIMATASIAIWSMVVYFNQELVKIKSKHKKKKTDDSEPS